jgi:taurine-pyruvate aminotransferase
MNESTMTTPSAKEWWEKDRQLIWHQMARYQPDAHPLVVTRAEGAWVTDVEGRKYLDGMAGLWCVNAGYGRQELARAAYEQLIEMPYYPLTQSHLPAIRLGEKLREWLGDDYLFFFSNSGSEANETAFKIARQYHRQNGEPDRYKFLSRYRAYHGNTLGAMSATGQAQRKYRYEPLVPGFLQVPPPDCYHCPFGKAPDSCARECAEIFDYTMNWEIDRTVAGVIMEPIITGGGILIPPDDYLDRVREICDRHGALLIIDEVICGFGRTGKPFGFMHYGIQPDIVTMAKGITSGYLPLAVTAVRKELFEAFKGTEEYDHFRHVNTFGGNPAACALAVENLNILEKEKLVERSATLGEQILASLSDVEDLPHVGQIRGKGLLIGIELVEDKETRQPANPDRVNAVVATCKELGVLVGKNGDTVAGFNNVIAISPPLSLTDEDAALLVKKVKQALQEHAS